MKSIPVYNMGQMTDGEMTRHDIFEMATEFESQNTALEAVIEVLRKVTEPYDDIIEEGTFEADYFVRTAEQRSLMFHAVFLLLDDCYEAYRTATHALYASLKRM